MILGLVILFVLLTAQALFLLSRCRLRFELGVPISLMVDMFVLLFCGLVLSDLRIGVYLIIAMSAAGAAAAILCERNRLPSFLSVFASPGFIVFVVGFVLCCFISMRHVTYAWDDFGHWLPFVRQMVNYDKLYTDASVYLIRHWYYTPAVPLIEYLACRLAGGYNAGVCFSACSLILFVSVLPLMKWLTFQKRRYSFFAVALVFFAIFITGHDDLNGFFIGFGSAYVDIQLGAVCAMLLLWGYFEKPSLLNSIYLGIIAAFLALIKVTGVMFALLGVGTYIIAQIFQMLFGKKSDRIREKPLRRFLSTILNWAIPLFCTVFFYVLWSVISDPDLEYSSILGVSLSDISFVVHKYGQGLTLRTVSLFAEWLRTYFYYFFTTEINGTALLPLTGSVFLILFLLLLIWKLLIDCRRQAVNVRLIALGLCVFLGLFVYLFAVGVSFYSLKENLESMTSYQRYLSSYIGVIIILSVTFGMQIFFSDLNFDGNKKAFIAIVLVALLVVTLPQEILYVLQGDALSTNDNSKENKTDYDRMTLLGENLAQKISEDPDGDPTVFLLMDRYNFLDTPSLSGEIAVVSYFLLPVRMQDFDQMSYYPNPALPFYSCDEWADLLADKEFSYVLLSNFSSDSMIWWESTSTNTVDKVSELFDIPPDELESDSLMLFKVVTDEDGEVQLQHVPVESPLS